LSGGFLVYRVNRFCVHRSTVVHQMAFHFLEAAGLESASLVIKVVWKPRPERLSRFGSCVRFFVGGVATKPDCGKHILCLGSGFGGRQDIGATERHFPGSAADIVLYDPCARPAFPHADSEPAKVGIEEHFVLQSIWQG
jgi:hypothetical protein